MKNREEGGGITSRGLDGEDSGGWKQSACHKWYIIDEQRKQNSIHIIHGRVQTRQSHKTDPQVLPYLSISSILVLKKSIS